MRNFANRGERHHKAVLTDSDVQRLRELHNEFPPGHPNHLGYRRLAKIFEVPRETVRRLAKGQHRV